MAVLMGVLMATGARGYGATVGLGELAVLGLLGAYPV